MAAGEGQDIGHAPPPIGEISPLGDGGNPKAGRNRAAHVALIFNGGYINARRVYSTHWKWAR